MLSHITALDEDPVGVGRIDNSEAVKQSECDNSKYRTCYKCTQWTIINCFVPVFVVLFYHISLLLHLLSYYRKKANSKFALQKKFALQIISCSE